MKIKKGDTVYIITGKDTGKKGKVEKVLVKKNKVIITGLNIFKKHTKPSKKNPQGGIIEFSAPIDISNVMIFCSKCDKPTKSGYRILKNKKQRFCKKCKEEI